MFGWFYRWRKWWEFDDDITPDTNTIHVYPLNDLVNHDTDSDDCVCGPTPDPVERDDGSMGWVMIHHALDGRD